MTAGQRVSNVRLLMSGLFFIAFALAIYRLYGGLGSATNLNDTFPWGLWIGFDMLCGVALASGGFVLAGAVHMFGLTRFEPFARPAITTAFLGYLLAIAGLILDLGRPWAIWHPLVMWQPHSVMFEVAWCVMLYTTVLGLEFLPIVFEKLRMERALLWLRRVMVALITGGIILSTMHQSSLGSLFLMMSHRLHALWFTPMLPVLFLVSSVAVGIAMVVFEAMLSGLIFGHRYPVRLLGDLSKTLPPVLGIYLGLKLMDVNARHVAGLAVDGSLESWAFLLELIVGAVLPGTLLLSPKVRYHRARLFGCALMVVAGVVLNRLNVCLLGMLATSVTGYVPSWIEVLVSAGIVAGGLLVLAVMNQHLPIVREETAAEAAQAPSHLGGREGVEGGRA